MRKVWKILCELWDTIERNSLLIIGVPEEKRRRKEQNADLKI